MAARRGRTQLRARQQGGRARYLSQIRLRHVLGAISSLHYGTQSSGFEGDDREGLYWARNWSGDHHVVAWDSSPVPVSA